MKKILLIISLLLLSSNITKAGEEILIEEKDEIKIIYKDQSLFIKNENSMNKITEFDLKRNAKYGLSPNSKYYSYSKNQGFSVYFYEIEKKEEKKIIESNDPRISIYFYQIIWSPSDDDNFFIIQGNDTIGNIELCYYEDLDNKYCISRIDGISSEESDLNNYLFLDDFFSIEYTNDNKLIFKKIINEDSEDDYELWETNLKGENSKKIIKNQKKELFPDIPTTSPLYDLSKKANKQGWLSGYGDGTLKPENPISRAEFAKMLLKAFEYEEHENADQHLGKFTDIVETAWYRGILAKAVELNIMNGYADGTIKPDNTVNKTEALKLALEMAGVELPEESGEWYEKYWKFIEGKEEFDFLSPLDKGGMGDSRFEDMTRGEAVELISVVLETQ